jgi:hypothetical protein
MLHTHNLFVLDHALLMFHIDYMQEGRNTVWPHNPQTGWSYCVIIPSWIVQTPEAGVTADSFLKSVVVSSVYLIFHHISPLVEFFAFPYRECTVTVLIP